MVCPPCRDGRCGECRDAERAAAFELGEIPGVSPDAPTASAWCDCGHQGATAVTPGGLRGT